MSTNIQGNQSLDDPDFILSPSTFRAGRSALRSCHVGHCDALTGAKKIWRKLWGSSTFHLDGFRHLSHDFGSIDEWSNAAEMGNGVSCGIFSVCCSVSVGDDTGSLYEVTDSRDAETNVEECGEDFPTAAGYCGADYNDDHWDGLRLCGKVCQFSRPSFARIMRSGSLFPFRNDVVRKFIQVVVSS